MQLFGIAFATTNCQIDTRRVTDGGGTKKSVSCKLRDLSKAVRGALQRPNSLVSSSMPASPASPPASPPARATRATRALLSTTMHRASGIPECYLQVNTLFHAHAARIHPFRFLAPFRTFVHCPVQYSMLFSSYSSMDYRMLPHGPDNPSTSM